MHCQNLEGEHKYLRDSPEFFSDRCIKTHLKILFKKISCEKNLMKRWSIYVNTRIFAY